MRSMDYTHTGTHRYILFIPTKIKCTRHELISLSVYSFFLSFLLTILCPPIIPLPPFCQFGQHFFLSFVWIRTNNNIKISKTKTNQKKKENRSIAKTMESKRHHTLQLDRHQQTYQRTITNRQTIIACSNLSQVIAAIYVKIPKKNHRKHNR